MTKFKNVVLIAAVGNNGQIGLKGNLPWHNPADLEFFKTTTSGHVVLVGKHTYATLPKLPNRLVYVQSRDKTLDYYVYMRDKHYPAKTLFIAGGATIYELWKPFVSRSIISHIDYDGEADTFMPHLW